MTGVGTTQLLAHALGGVAFVGLWLRWDARSHLLSCATLGAVLWMAVDVVDNGLVLQRLPRIAAAFAAGDASKGAEYLSLTAFADALRMTAHFAGGCGVVGASAYALRANTLPRVLGWAGVLVGAVLAANVFAPPLMFASMLTLPAWLVACGVVVARRDAPTQSAVRLPTAAAGA